MCKYDCFFSDVTHQFHLQTKCILEEALGPKHRGLDTTIQFTWMAVSLFPRYYGRR